MISKELVPLNSFQSFASFNQYIPILDPVHLFVWALQQLRLFLCYCAVSEWLYGTRTLSQCHGKPGMDPVRNLLWLWDGMCGIPWGHCSCCCGVGSAPAMEVSGVGNVTKSLETGMVPQQRVTHFLSLLQASPFLYS